MSLAEIRNLLFGQEKGSTTVDLAAKPGLLEQSKGGTLFINNLDALPVEIFKVFTSQEFERIGSLTKIKIEARLLGAATPNLVNRKKEIFEFFSGILIEIPTLKDRGSDIPLLINHFLDEYGAQYQKEIKIESAALDAMIGYAWPGNTRQLESVIERLVLTTTDNIISLDNLPLDILLKTTQGAGSGFIAAFEKEYIQKILERSGNNKTKAAAFLGINPTLLEVKM
jgi:DNA-binding NtrC family response regulator